MPVRLNGMLGSIALWAEHPLRSHVAWHAMSGKRDAEVMYVESLHPNGDAATIRNATHLLGFEDGQEVDIELVPERERASVSDGESNREVVFGLCGAVRATLAREIHDGPHVYPTYRR